jgi:hypothetical protein
MTRVKTYMVQNGIFNDEANDSGPFLSSIKWLSSKVEFNGQTQCSLNNCILFMFMQKI